MIITYLRSSSINQFSICQQSYFINYILGHKDLSGRAAILGTITHKVFEVLGNIKKEHDKDKNDYWDDELKLNYECNRLPDIEQIEKLTSECYQLYTKVSNHVVWSDKDYKSCWLWVRKVLNSDYNPLTLKYIDVEKRFDITVDEEWAKYCYDYKGEKLFGQMALKGTIDTIIEPAPGVLEIVDWKTGRYKKDWATGEEKTREKLKRDIQLGLYHYVVRKMYPEYEHVLITIYFINVGKGMPDTMCFELHDLPQTEEIIKETFDKIRDAQIPKLVPSHNKWMCKKLCHYGKNTFEGTHVKPIVNKGFGKQSNVGEYMTMCDQTCYAIKHRGVDSVVDNMTKPDFDPNYYQAPGSTD